MLQREVVDRMAAAPGSKVYGRLSVMLQYRFRWRSCSMFRPARSDPRRRWTRPSCGSRRTRCRRRWRETSEVLRRMVAKAFSQRRKTLRNALCGLHDRRGARQRWAIDPRLRPGSCIPGGLRARGQRRGCASVDVRTSQACAGGLKPQLLGARFLDELDLVAVGIFDEGDHCRAVLHRAGLARHFAAALA